MQRALVFDFALANCSRDRERDHLSLLEEQISALVPDEIPDLNGTGYPLSTGPGLMTMDEGWTVGGSLARFAAAQIRKRWREQQPGCSSEPDHNTLQPKPGCSADELLDFCTRRRR